MQCSVSLLFGRGAKKDKRATTGRFSFRGRQKCRRLSSAVIFASFICFHFIFHQHQGHEAFKRYLAPCCVFPEDVGRCSPPRCFAVETGLGVQPGVGYFLLLPLRYAARLQNKQAVKKTYRKYVPILPVSHTPSPPACCKFYTKTEGSRGCVPRASAPDDLQRPVWNGLPADSPLPGSYPVCERGSSTWPRVRGEGGNYVHLHHGVPPDVLHFGVSICDVFSLGRRGEERGVCFVCTGRGRGRVGGKGEGFLSSVVFDRYLGMGWFLL